MRLTQASAAKTFKNSLGAILIVLGGVLLVPSSMAISQYNKTKDPSTGAKVLYGFQIAFVVIATLAIIAGIVMLVVKAKTK